MRCPKCGHEWKDEGRAKGGRASRRTITTEQQARMQAARTRRKADEHNTAFVYLGAKLGAAGGYACGGSAQ